MLGLYYNTIILIDLNFPERNIVTAVLMFDMVMRCILYFTVFLNDVKVEELNTCNLYSYGDAT